MLELTLNRLDVTWSRSAFLLASQSTDTESLHDLAPYIAPAAVPVPVPVPVLDPCRRPAVV